MSRLQPVLLGVLGALTLATALGVVYARFETRSRFVELQRLYAARDELQVEWGQLQLEQSTWTTHGRFDKVARERLGMRIPLQSSVVVLP
jgi:cell division protein FtsL